MFISLLYMFRATQCSSSGESILSIYLLVYITLCMWPSGMQVSDLHTRRPHTQSDIYQMMYWYNWLSWWWALGCLIYVQKWNKHIKKCVKLVINKNLTNMYGQQNTKFGTVCSKQFLTPLHSKSPPTQHLQQHIYKKQQYGVQAPPFAKTPHF